MKRAAYIFILLYCFGFKLISAKTEPVFALTQLSDLKKHESISKEKSPTSIINANEYHSLNKILLEKKIRQRGLVTVFYIFIEHNPLLIGYLNKKLIFTSQTFYLFRLFIGNEKRGPPMVLGF